MADPAKSSGIGLGTVVGGTYEITRLLGRGGMGSVWAASHKRLPGKQVAIKVLHSDVSQDTEALARFRREAEIASRLGHPNIIEVHDFNTLPDGKPYLVLEYLDGESLDARLQRGALSYDDACSMLRQIGSALAAAHAENVIHRDLKPQNVFLVPTDVESYGGELVKLLDFGISKIRGSTTVKTHDSTILGTPQYMAPEQAVGNHDKVDQTTDIFALGAMLYEMVAGQPAFRGQTIPEVVFKVVYEAAPPLAELAAHLPASAIAAVHKALEKEQEKRFATVGEFVEAFTGAPLSYTRKTTAPTSMEHDTALASTMASGEFPPPLDVGIAATLDSGRHAAGSVAPTIASSLDGQVFVPEQPAGVSVKFALAGGVLVTAAVIAFFVMSGDKATKQATTGEQPLAVVQLDAMTESDTPPSPSDITSDPIDSKQPDDLTTAREKAAETKAAKDKAAKKKVAKDKAAKKKVAKDKAAKKKAARDKAANDKVAADRRSEVKPHTTDQDLADARAALRRGDYASALHSAHRAANKGIKGANAVRVMAHCGDRDLSNARAFFHRVRKRHRLRVARYCEKHGDIFLLDD